MSVSCSWCGEKEKGDSFAKGKKLRLLLQNSISVWVSLKSWLIKILFTRFVCLQPIAESFRTDLESIWLSSSIHSSSPYKCLIADNVDTSHSSSASKCARPQRQNRKSSGRSSKPTLLAQRTSSRRSPGMAHLVLRIRRKFSSLHLSPETVVMTSSSEWLPKI